MTGWMLVLTAATPSIGVIRANGEFRVNGSTIQGNSALFDGNLVETAAVRSLVRLANLEMAMLPQSRVKVYRDHTTLEQGSSLVTNARNYVLEAGSIRISSREKDSEWQVQINGPDRTSVSARKGGAEVRNSSGVLLAVLRPGMSLAFMPEDGASASAVTKLTGVVERQNGAYLLTDLTSNVRFELRGKDLDKFTGQRVEITGSIIPGAVPAAGASQVVQVADEPKRTGGAAVTTAAGGEKAGTAGGMSKTTIAGISIAVAAGGILGGLAASGTFSGAAPLSKP